MKDMIICDPKPLFQVNCTAIIYVQKNIAAKLYYDHLLNIDVIYNTCSFLGESKEQIEVHISNSKQAKALNLTQLFLAYELWIHNSVKRLSLFFYHGGYWDIVLVNLERQTIPWDISELVIHETISLPQQVTGR